MFQVSVQDGLARCGLITLAAAQKQITTPAPMLYTRRGSAISLTPDMLEKLRPEGQLLQICALQFLNQPSPEVLRAHGGGAAGFMGLPGWPLFASNRDASQAEYLGSKPASDEAAYATLHSGALAVTPARYMECLAALAPDMAVALADEVPADARPRRLAASVNRTAAWLDECIQLQQQQQQQEAVDKAGGQAAAAAAPACRLFAPVVGGASLAERARSAKAAAERQQHVAGFALCGFGMGEPLSARPALLAAALQPLPQDKPRVVVGLDSPEDVLSAVAAGVDLFDSSYALHATANGYALAFPITQQQAEQQAAEQQQQAEQQQPTVPPSPGAAGLAAAAAAAASSADAKQGGAVLAAGGGAALGDAALGADDSKLNLWAAAYRLDVRPLVPGCSCWACARHSRAYIHHLLHTHEILAGVLLELHNSHWWLAWFGAIRGAVAEGRLAEYRQWFEGRRAAAQQQQPAQQQLQQS